MFDKHYYVKNKQNEKRLALSFYKKLIKRYINPKTLLDYGVYQVEADGLDLFEYIKGDINSIMGLPIKDIINYIKQYKT